MTALEYIDFVVDDPDAAKAALDEFTGLIDADEYADSAYAALRGEVVGLSMDMVGREGNSGPAYWRWIASNGLAIWVLNDNGLGLSVEYPETTLSDMVDRHDVPDGSDTHQMRASWGLDPRIEESNEDDTDVRIWIKPNYYENMWNRPHQGWVTDSEDSWPHEPKIFARFADAKAWIEGIESGTYYLSHGEASRPEYTICK